MPDLQKDAPSAENNINLLLKFNHLTELNVAYSAVHYPDAELGLQVKTTFKHLIDERWKLLDNSKHNSISVVNVQLL